MKLQPESKKELLRIAGGTAFCTAIMWVLFAALHLVGWVKFDYTVVLGSLVGAAVAIGNFAGICFVVQKSSTSRMRSAARQHYSFPTTAGCCCRRCGWWWPSRPLLPALCQCAAAVFPPCHHLLPANNGQVQTAHAEGRAGGRLGGGRPRTCRRAAVHTR